MSKWICLVVAVLAVTMPTMASAAVFLDNKTQLQDGDIILENAGGLISSMIQEVGRPVGLYTHAAVYIDLPKAGGRVISFTTNGLKILNPAKLSSHLYHAALVRPVSPPSAGILAAAFARIKARPLRFDYSLQWPKTDSPVTDCVGLVSQIYRLAGLADPFPLPKNIGNRTALWDAWAKKNYGLDFSRIISPNAVLSAPRFRVVATYENKDPNVLRQQLIAHTALGRIRTFMTDDRMIPQSRLGNNIIISLSRIVKIDGEDADLSPVQRRAFLAIQEYLLAVKKRVNRTLYLRDTQDWTKKDIVKLTIDVTNAYKNRYLKPSDVSVKP